MAKKIKKKQAKKNIQKQGFCPKCGAPDLEYGSSDIDGESLGYEYNCNACGAYGREWYNIEYSETSIDGQTDI